MAAMIEVLHVGKVILHVDDLVVICLRFGAMRVGAMDVVDARQSGIELDILVEVLCIEDVIIHRVVIQDTNALLSAVHNLLKAT